MAESLSMVSVRLPRRFPAGEIIGVNISAETFIAEYAADFCEWVEGVVIQMAPVTEAHDWLTAFFRQWLDAYFALHPIGQVRQAPFVLRLESRSVSREPDLQIVLHGNAGQLTPTAMIGAADICLEIVSEESRARDYGDKFKDYEAAGVREYWIIDPLQQEASFYRLNTAGRYARQTLDGQGQYITPLLPRFALPVALLWRDPKPDILAIVDIVRQVFRAE